MNCNMLVDVLPYEVEIDGKMYRINTDFRVSILFELLIQSDLEDIDKLVQALQLYYPVLPEENIEEAVHKMLWFYSCGKEKHNVVRKSAEDDDSEQETNHSAKQIYSFEYDDDYIYAAFMTQYHIDLQDIEHLHWWKFRALFKSLEDKREFVKIMGYRGTKITNDMSKREKDFVNKMKRIHALPLPESEQKMTDALTEALLKGEDVSKLLNGG